ncbi:zinc finger protein 43-like isoform X2 [Daktulosphaira vitifoliae]|nr:zinc finger protein 43-like isoform X2 [Daktulosphaira vitifoliae]XP_050523815.1 zinc finger protein 43-like isoform X2 [Daktulosphaira vitifoliae]XP_050523816.1 zinc finger protein 43-like isoform X2 [Daktulosphaira vitifoliae]XP_050523817.1 zinc finger protein 43-like isoform X2 [Daktulosphaira vitifoliae]
MVSQFDNTIIKTEIKSEVNDVLEIKLEPLDEDHTYINNQLLDTISSEDYSYSSLMCDMCYKNYDDPYDLIVHKKVSHAEKPYTCMFCNEKFVLCAHLNMHMSEHTENTSYLLEPTNCITSENKLFSNTTFKISNNIECLKLKDKNFQNANAKIHIKNLVKENSHPESSNVRKSLRICSRKSANELKPFTCPNCSFATISKNKMLLHKCNKYTNIINIIKTKKIHVPKNKQSTYNCNFCNKSFIKRQSLCGHLKCHSNKVVFKNKKMSITKNIKMEKTDENEHEKKLCSENHFIMQNKSKAYKCEYCFRSYFTSKALNVHVRMHTQKFLCKICHKMFFLKINFKKHMMYHHSLKQNNSDKTLEVDKSCSTNKYKTSQNKIINSVMLKKQVNVKNDKSEKPYQCSYCSIRFSSTKYLQNHFTTLHANKYLKNLRVKKNFFPCQWCSKKFSWSSGLYRHYRSAHKSIKPFKCVQCAKCFSDYTSYRVHKRNHNLLK